MNKQDLIDFELKVKAAWEAGEIKAPVHFSGGNEDQLIEIFKEINTHDYVFSSHRNHYHALLHGVPHAHLYDEIYNGPNGTCHGRAKSMGYINVSRQFYSSAIVGGCCAIAVGVAWALKREHEENAIGIDELASPPRHVWAFVGDGAVDGGHFWEALQYALNRRLPVTFVIEENDRATCSDNQARFGQSQSTRAWMGMLANDFPKYCRVYNYKPTWPHVGTGKYVQF